MSRQKGIDFWIAFEGYCNEDVEINEDVESGAICLVA